MNVVRSVVVALVTGMVALWLVSAASTGTPVQGTSPSDSPVSSTPAIDPPLFDLSVQAGRLERGRAAARASARSRRNLFEFGRSNAIEAAPPVSPAGASSVDAAAPVGDPEPLLSLIGIAERGGPETPARIAILTGIGQLFLVAPGETVANRYQVVAVHADAVELRDEASGETVRLMLP